MRLDSEVVTNPEKPRATEDHTGVFLEGGGDLGKRKFACA